MSDTTSTAGDAADKLSETTATTRPLGSDPIVATDPITAPDDPEVPQVPTATGPPKPAGAPKPAPPQSGIGPRIIS